VSDPKVPFAVLRSCENYSFTMSKIRIFRLRRACNWHFRRYRYRLVKRISKYSNV